MNLNSLNEYIGNGRKTVFPALDNNESIFFFLTEKQTGRPGSFLTALWHQGISTHMYKDYTGHTIFRTHETQDLPGPRTHWGKGGHISVLHFEKGPFLADL